MSTPDVTRKREKKKEELASLFEQAARDAVRSANTKAKRCNADYRALMTGAGIATDKMLLLRGEGPSQTEAERTATEAIRKCAEMVVRMAELAGRKVTVEQVERRIKEIQVERCKFTVTEETITRAGN